jgi:hypothetical protein
MKKSVMEKIKAVRDGKASIREVMNEYENSGGNAQDLMYEIIRHVSPDMVEDAFLDTVNEDFKPSEGT